MEESSNMMEEVLLSVSGDVHVPIIHIQEHTCTCTLGMTYMYMCACGTFHRHVFAYTCAEGGSYPFCLIRCRVL